MAFFTPFLCSSSLTQKRARALALSLAAFVCALSCSAYADESPFQFENTHWMSFDRYKENVKKGAAAPADNPDKESSPANSATAADAHDINGDSPNPITPPAMASEVAAPTRPINIPVMPGMNKGYEMRVNSTEDERPPLAHITNIDTQPQVALPNRNWQTPKEAARHPNQDADGNDENEHQPLDVRMSFLPNNKVSPVPSPEYKSTHGRKAPTATAAVPEPEKKADLAACAAVDAYKKKQLEAIESDRETLTNLQKAITQLGLQKELSFMSGANGAVNQADSNAGKMDMPPAMAAPAKN